MLERNGIPKFDLAEQIMSEHRKNASVKRKGPARKVQPSKREPKLELVNRAVVPHAMPPGRERVIADIVARDIERLCTGRA